MQDFEIEGGILKKYTGQGSDVVIPDGVTRIGDSAFWNCDSLTSITLPASVTNIGNSAFWRCRSLTSITIPESVTSIGDSAFSCCHSLTSIILSNSVKSIGRGAFYDCRNLTSITIPESVTSIDDNAFSCCHSLTRIILPDSVTSIGRGAFSNCGHLTNITIPESVTSIGDHAFRYCGALSQISLPKGVITVGERVFADCSKLVKIVLPDTLEKIGDGVFAKCTVLEEIVIPDNPKFGSGDWFRGEYTDDVLPQKLQKKINVLEPFMDDKAFIRIFKKAAVWNSLSYERQADVYLHRHIAKLKPIFKKFIKPKDCEAIAKEILLKLNDKSSAKERNAIKDYLIDYYADISEQSFISLYRKMGNKGRLAIAEELKNCDDFRLREILTEVDGISLQKDEMKSGLIEGNIEEIPSKQCAADVESAIKGMTFVVTGDMKNFGVREETWVSDYNDYTDLKMYIEERGAFLRTSVSSKTNYLICNDQTKENGKLKKARDLGISVITEDEFLKMTGADVKPPETTDFLITKGGILKEYTGKATEISIPPEVRIIDHDVFSCLRTGLSLEKVFIPEGVTEIKWNAFFLCQRLKHVSFCEGLKIIGDCAFQGCALEEIKIPSSVRVVGNWAFDCKNINKIEIYDSVERIGRNSFDELRPSENLEIKINCIAHKADNQRQIILALGLDNVAYAFLHDRLTASEYIIDQIRNRLKAKNNRMYLMARAIDLNDMSAIKKLLSLDVKRSKKENEEIITIARERNNIEAIAYLININHFKED